MDVIGFLHVSLGIYRVQLHDSSGSRRACVGSEAGFSSQNGEGAWGYTTEEQRSVLRILWAEEFTAKDIH
jgi:hypothetical protein